MKRRSILLITLPLFTLQLHAQYNINQDKVWAFGDHAGLDFTSGVPVPIETAINTFEGCASVCDAAGHLLFYTDGKQVYNRLNNIMPNGGSVINYPTGSTSQAAVIVPVFADLNKYYLFSIEQIQDYLYGDDHLACRLFYNIIDMGLDGGLGDVAAGSGGQVIATGMSEKMIAIPGNNCDIWLVAHKREAPVFLAFHITGAGIDTTPVISSAGYLSGYRSYGNGVMKSSQDRKKIAVASLYANTDSTQQYPDPMGVGAELCDFDPATGIVSNAILIENGSGYYGAEFSPDNTKLYLYGEDTTPGPNNKTVVQFNIGLQTPAAVIASRAVIVDSLGDDADLRLGPDGKIYISDRGFPQSLDYISNPNASGAACNFAAHQLDLYDLTTEVMVSLGSQFVVPIGNDTSYTHQDTIVCAGQDVTLNAPQGLSYHWYDGSTGAANVVHDGGSYWVAYTTYCSTIFDTFHVTSQQGHTVFRHIDSFICTPLNEVTLYAAASYPNYVWQDGSTLPSLAVNNAGIYWATASNTCSRETDTFQVHELMLPLELMDVTVCREQPVIVTLHSGVPASLNILWSSGSTSPDYVATDTGVYWVQVTDGKCIFSDTATVHGAYCACEPSMPTAFTPNRDGKNDEYRPVSKQGCPMYNLRFHIYNRWGQQIFFSDDLQHGWDGTFNGKQQDVGEYMYYLRYQSDAGIEYFKKGDVTLVR